jgi:nucleoid-associated protein YgaU
MTTSRYDGQGVVVVAQDDGTTRALGVPRIAVTAAVAVLYQVHDGDRLDRLANAALGDTTGWWLIADANPPLDPLRLERTGTVIGVPDG